MQVAQDCSRLGKVLSAHRRDGESRFIVAKSSTGYRGDVRICGTIRGTRGMEVYAKPRSLVARGACDLITAPNRSATEVMRITSSDRPPVFLVLQGLPALTSFSAREFLHVFPRSQIVQGPQGKRACFIHGPIDISVYSPSKNAAARICHSLSAASKG